MSQFYWQSALSTPHQQQDQKLVHQQPSREQYAARNDSGNNWSYIGLGNDEGAANSQKWPQQYAQMGIDPYSAAAFGGFSGVSSSDYWNLSAQQGIQRHQSNVSQAPSKLGQITTVNECDSEILHHNSNSESGNIAVIYRNSQIDEQNSLNPAAALPNINDVQHHATKPTQVVAMAEVAPMVSSAPITHNSSSPSEFLGSNVACVNPLQNQPAESANNDGAVSTIAPHAIDEMGTTQQLQNQETPQNSIPHGDEKIETLRVNDNHEVNVESDKTEGQNSYTLNTPSAKNIMNDQQNSQQQFVQENANLSLPSAPQNVKKEIYESNGSLNIDSSNKVMIKTESSTNNIQSSKMVTSSVANLSEDSTTAESIPNDRSLNQRLSNSKNVRERYRTIRQQYPEVVKRLDRLKMEARGLDWRSIPKSEPLVEEIPNSAERIGRREANSGAVHYLHRHAEPFLLDSRPTSKLSHSNTLPEKIGNEQAHQLDTTFYGDEVVNALRRARRSRYIDADLPSRGTKSEMGEIGPYRGPGALLHRQYMNRSAFGHNPHEFRNKMHHSMGPNSGRHTAHELAFQDRDLMHPQRPQSSFDAPVYNRTRGNSTRNSVYELFATDDNKEVDKGDDDLSDGNQSSGCDSEIAQIHYEQEMVRRTAAMHYNGVPATGQNEYYFFGVIQLSQDLIRNIMLRLPPPPEYFHLPPIEKAAYLFYCALYQQYYEPIDLFHKKFNREFYRYTCDGDSSELALWKICKHTQEEFLTKRSINHLKAYEMSQKHLFSDDRETLDSRSEVYDPVLKMYLRSQSEIKLSDRGSRRDLEEESDHLSLDSGAREPLKFRSAHSFLNFGIGGKAIVLNAHCSENVIELRDVKNLIVEPVVVRLTSIIESFQGPIIPGFTPTHSVRLYIQRQIETILKSKAYLENIENAAIRDILLLWQLLEILVQQQGRVTGPDLSRILMSDGTYDEKKSSTCIQNECSADLNDGYLNFTNLLLGGHIKEAIDCAIRDGLYSDAMILARRIYPHEPKIMEKIENAFLYHRCDQNPVMTLLSVANGLPAPVLTSPPVESSSWRAHVAIVLANLHNSEALGTVYQLGRVLALRQQHAAADFCFLAVHLLSPSYDPFSRLQTNDEELSYRQDISLIHANYDEDSVSEIEVANGFSVVDLHATEIFEYATRLANNNDFVTLSRSLSYQWDRLKYANIIAELGGFATDAFSYCVEVAKSIWNICNEVDIGHLEHLYALADSLKCVGAADPNDAVWLTSLQSLIDQRKTDLSRQHDEQVNNVATPLEEYDVNDSGLTMVANRKASSASGDSKNETINQEIKTLNLEAEAVNWHENYQGPINMSERQDGHQTGVVQKNIALHDELQFHSGTENKFEKVDDNNTSSATSQYLSLSTSPTDNVKNQPFVPGTGSVPQTNNRTSEISTDGTHHDDTESKKSRDSQSLSQTGKTALGIHSLDESDSPNEITTDVVTSASSSHESTPHRSFKAPLHKPREEVYQQSFQQKTNQPNIDQTVNVKKEPAPRGTIQPIRNVQSTGDVNERAFEEMKGMPERLNSGLFGKLKAKIARAIPSNNEMILPDDKNPSIIWDPKLNKYVGTGVEEEAVPEPPPSVPSFDRFNSTNNTSVGGLTAARLSGGSRYFNPLIETTPLKAVSRVAPIVPAVPISTFGFIPSMPDGEDVPTDSPFSIAQEPQLPETEVAE